MAVASACQELQRQLDEARGVRNAQRLFTQARKDADDKVDRLQAKYKACKKANTRRKGILYAKGLARAAKDASVPFALQPGFEKAGIGRADDAARQALKVKGNKDLADAGRTFAKQHDLDEAVQYAAVGYALQDAKKAAQAGFISAQVAAAVLDIVASIFTWGGYAAAAPFVHGAIGAGQKVSMDALKKDIELNEARYKGALEKRQRKIDEQDAKADLQAAESEATALEAAAKTRLAVAAAPPPPWYTQPVVVGAGLLVLLAGGVAWASREKQP